MFGNDPMQSFELRTVKPDACMEVQLKFIFLFTFFSEGVPMITFTGEIMI
jgi:hypothetical protein